MKRNRFKRFFVYSRSVMIAATLVFSFQNCSQEVQFSKDYSSSTKLSVTSIDGSGLYYTNQKTVPLKISGGSQYMTEMRASPFADMDAAKVPWEKRESTLLADLATEFAADGSKDGIKTIYIEVRDPSADLRLANEVSVFLDTQVPNLTGTGILNTGVQGTTIKKNEQVKLKWIGEDKSAPNGVSSGIDQNSGLKYGVSYNGDCSDASLKTKTDWIKYDSGATIGWPEDDRLKAFYFCVYIRDRAGNVATLLSQPMTGIWQVIAGDNNQGNGGSVLAKNVRFGYPTRIAVDSKNNTYVLDAYLNVIRKIAPNGDISLLAGNGVSGPITEGNATTTSISIGEIVFDSKDRMYALGNGAIWRILLPTAATPYAQISRWITGVTGSVSINVDRLTDTVYLTHKTTTQSLDSASRIYKFSIDVVDAAYTGTNRMAFTEVLNRFSIAGNGLGLASTTAATAVVPATASVDYPTAIAPTDSEDVYFATTSDGSAFPFGHQQIRLLRKDAAGVLQNYLVTSAIPWIHKIEYMHYTDDKNVEQKYLVVTSDSNGIRKVDLTGTVLPVPASAVTNLDPYPATDLVHPVRVGGVAPIFDVTATSRKLNRILFAESNNSRLTVLKPDFTLSVNYGRPVYDPKDSRAIEAMVNNPDSVVATKNGDIYFTEPLTHIIRKVDSQGVISLVAGKPNAAAQTGNVTSTFDNFSYNGLTFTYGGRYALAYNPVADHLYFSEGYNGHIRTLDLATKAVTPFGPLLSRSANQDSWAPFGLAMTPTANPSLVVYRSNPYFPNVGTAVRMYTPGSTVGTAVAGNGVMGAVTNAALANATALPAAVNATAFDSALNYYFSGSGGTFKIDYATKVVTRLTASSFNGLQVIEDGTTTHVIGTSTTAIYDIKIVDGGTPTQITLCLPGTFLNRGIEVKAAADGNLIIADSRNDRILKYYIRDLSNTLRFFDQTCKQ